MKTWVLDTDTKGTGAQMVPLEKVLREPASKAERTLARRGRPALSDEAVAAPEPAEPKEPPKFRVVDVMTQRVLAEGADTREAVELLGKVRSIVDVAVYKWDRRSERWRKLSQRERRLLWAFRSP